MKPDKIILQRLNAKTKDSLDTAFKYYKIIALINNIKITNRELQLIAFIAVKGNISYSTSRKEFCDLYGSTSASINNMISTLTSVGFLIRDNRKIKVAPVIMIDFSKEINLVIKFVENV